MTTRPEDRGPRMPSAGTDEIQTAYGEPQRRSGGRAAPEHRRNDDQVVHPLDRRQPGPGHHARHRRAPLTAICLSQRAALESQGDFQWRRLASGTSTPTMKMIQPITRVEFR